VDPRPGITLHEGIRFTRTGLDARFADTTFFPFPFDAIVQRHTALNGTLGLIVRPGTGWRVSLGAASGFRAPNVDDLAKVFESVPGNLIVPNPDIRPEYTYNGEISLSKVLHDRVTLSATGYYTRYVNALTTQPATLNGQDSVVFDGQLSRVSSVTNAGRAYIWGAEGQVSANLGEKLAVSGTVVYTYGRIRTDTTAYPLDHIPPLFGRVRVHYAHRNVQAAFFVQYSGWKRVKDYNLIGEDNYSYATPDGMPAWYTLNARCTWQFLPYLSLQVACENILDRNYRVFASNISAPGRNVIVTLRYQR
jgi:hemoglobin/transferrin/lactoferrin receptor protein